MIRLMSLILLNAGLVGVLTWQIGTGPMPATTAPVPRVAHGDLPSVVVEPVSELAPPALAARPLFSAVATPRLPEASAASRPTRPPLRLLGTTIGAEKAVAIVQSDSSRGPIRLIVGETIDSWRAKAIDRGGVDLIAMDGSGRRMRLELDPPTGKAVP